MFCLVFAVISAKEDEMDFDIEVECYTDNSLVDDVVHVIGFDRNEWNDCILASSDSSEGQNYAHPEKAASSTQFYTRTNCVACLDHDYDGIQMTTWEGGECFDLLDMPVCHQC